MVKLYICLKTARVKMIVEQVCKDIFVIDKTFNFTIFKNKRFRGKEKDCMFIASIDCKDKDDAHRRGSWFIGKVDVGDVGMYYWIKE